MLVELDPKLPVLPPSITKRIGELFGRLFEPFQRRAGPARAEYIRNSVGATRSNYYYLTPPRWPGPVSTESHYECRSGSKKAPLFDLRLMDRASASTARTGLPPSARPGLLSSKCGPGQCWHRPKRGRLYATKIIIWGRNCTNN